MSNLKLFVPNEGRSFTLKPIREYVVGSSQSECQIVLADEQVSSQHLMFSFNQSENTWYLQDLGSETGTFVNNQRVSNFPLRTQAYIALTRTSTLIATPEEQPVQVGQEDIPPTREPVYVPPVSQVPPREPVYVPPASQVPPREPVYVPPASQFLSRSTNEQVEMRIKEASATTTVMSVIALIFGGMAMLASFIPCLGVFAIWVALPSSILAGIATYLAYSKAEPKTFPLLALTISVIGLVISGAQYLALGGIGAGIHKGIQEGIEQQQPYRRR